MRSINYSQTRRGAFWRVQSDDDGQFDEIVVQDRGALILHAEMMNEHSCFINVAGRCFWVNVGKDGVAQIVNEEDRREDRFPIEP